MVGPCMMICQLGWEKIDLIRALKHLAAMHWRGSTLGNSGSGCVVKRNKNKGNETRPYKLRT